MSGFALTGNDTSIIFGRNLTFFGKGDVVKVDYASDFVKVEQGKNGNTIYALDNSGLLAKLTVKVLRGSPDDVFLSGIVAAAQADLPSFELGAGTFVKRIGQGNGQIVYDTYQLGGICPTKLQPASENTDGDAEQAQTMYEFTAAASPRAQL